MRATGAGGVDNDVAGKGRAGFERDTLDPAALAIKRHDLVSEVLHAAAPGHAAHPVEHGAAVEITFVPGVVIAGQDVVELVEGVAFGDLVAGHVPGSGPEPRLYLLGFLQGCGEGGGVGEVKIAKALQCQRWNIRVTAHEGAEIADEFGAELGNADVDLV